MAHLALTRDRFIDLEVNAWVWTKNGKKSGISSVRKRDGIRWDRLDDASRALMTPEVDALYLANYDLDDFQISTPLPAYPNLANNDAVLTWPLLRLERLMGLRSNLLAAVDRYALVRNAMPENTLILDWLEAFREDHEMQRIAEVAQHIAVERARRTTTPNTRNFGSLSGSWEVAGNTSLHAQGPNAKFIKTYVKRDDNRQIVDRVVIKEEGFMPLVPTTWDSTTRPGQNLPIEIAAMLRLRSRIGSDKIVKLRNWRIEAPVPPATRTARFRVYLEFCGYGDLLNAMPWPPPPAGIAMPEAFIWKLLDDLVTALTILDRGDIDAGGAAWERILHRDLKMDNIFLAEPGNTFCRYPTAKLADFGHAMIIPARDQRPFALLNHNQLGTVDHKPPEQWSDMLTGTPAPQRMNTKSNIWGVALAIRGLMESRYGAPEMTNQAQNGPSGTQMPNNWSARTASYSNMLKNLITDCLAYLPTNRPTLDILQQRVQIGMATYCQNLRHAAANDPRWDPFVANIPTGKFAMTAPTLPGDDLGGNAGTFMVFRVLP